VDSIAAAVRRVLGSPGFKFFLICGLIILLLIPLLLVWALITEREGRAESVRDDVAREWGGTQSIDGPVLIVPYMVQSVTFQGDKRVEELHERRAVFLPQTLNVRGKATTKVLHRSIYDVAVYTGSLEFEGRFDPPDMSEVAADVQSVRWRDAVLAVAIGDVSGLKSTASVLIDGDTKIPFEPSLGVPDANAAGIHARLVSATQLFDALPTATTGSPPKGFTFRFGLTLNGTSELAFAPVARETKIDLNSDWPDPGFSGAFLPTDRVVNLAGFSAHWQVPHLARSVPQAWTLTDFGLQTLRPYRFGVRFVVPVDFYQVVERAAKYALMVLATAFMAVFVLELKSALTVHPVQYVFLGLAMVFFYVLLLSFSERNGFLWAYLIAAIATSGLISVYVGRVQRSSVKGLIMLVVLALLYGLLYLILQLEDYALLAGAIAGFLMLAAVMFGTLRVNWSGEKPST
jgi:inner membrane protein